MKHIICILLVVIAYNKNSAQDPSEVHIIESLFEDLDNLESIDISQLQEDLLDLHHNPVKINTADINEIMRIPFITENEADGILKHIEAFGTVLCLEELQLVPELSIEKIKALKAYLTFNNNIGRINLKHTAYNKHHSVALLWGRKSNDTGTAADSSNTYLGSPDYLRLRYSINLSNKIKSKVILEKDAGEPFIHNQGIHIDHIAGHIQFSKVSRHITNITLGHFRVNMAQGLLIHNAFGFGKTMEPSNLIKYGNSVQAFNALDENMAFRGVVVESQVKNIYLTAFFSSRNRDATVVHPTGVQNHESYFTSFRTSGLHRTESELNARNKLNETNFGVALKKDLKTGHISINHLYSSFEIEKFSIEQLERLYDFRGATLSNTSLEFLFKKQGIFVLSELAISQWHSPAFIISTGYHFKKDHSIAFYYRNYSKSYHSFYSKAIGETGTANNEKGLLMNFSSKLFKNVYLSLYIDYWQHPWLRFRVSKPSSGKEISSQIKYQANKSTMVYIQFFSETKEMDVTESKGRLISTAERKRKRIRLHFSHKPHPDIELRSRLEISNYKHASITSRTHMFYQDIIYRPIQSDISANIRMALINGDSFDSRVYSYENGLIGDSGFKAYYGNAMRYYLNVRAKLSGKTTIEAHWSRTYSLKDKTEFVQDQARNTDRQSTLRIQLKLKF